jgi:hypothetical protein
VVVVVAAVVVVDGGVGVGAVPHLQIVGLALHGQYL